MDDERSRLLREAKLAGDAVEHARDALGDAGERRRRAIQAAMDAGIPRAEIADALGIRREVIYQILKRGKK